MLKVSNKSTRKKCEIFPGRNYSDKKICGEILWWLISGGGEGGGGGLLSRGELFRGNCLRIVVFGEIMQG